MMKSELCVFFIVLGTISAFGLHIGRTQSAGVKGILMCNDKPASKVKVKLYDDDRGLMFFHVKCAQRLF